MRCDRGVVVWGSCCGGCRSQQGDVDQVLAQDCCYRRLNTAETWNSSGAALCVMRTFGDAVTTQAQNISIVGLRSRGAVSGRAPDARVAWWRDDPTATRLSISIRSQRAHAPDRHRHHQLSRNRGNTVLSGQPAVSETCFVWIGCRCLDCSWIRDAGTRRPYPHAYWVATGSSRTAPWQTFTAPRHPVLQATCSEVQPPACATAAKIDGVLQI